MLNNYIVSICKGSERHKIWISEARCEVVNGWLRFDNVGGLIAAFAPGYWVAFKSA